MTLTETDRLGYDPTDTDGDVTAQRGRRAAPKPPKAPRAPKPPKPPRPPRRMPQQRPVPPPLTPRERFIRGILIVTSLLLLALVINVTLVGQVRHFVSQQQLSDTFRAQLKEGVAPVAEGDVHDVLLPDGAPVALLEIPKLGIKEIIVEGTDAGTMQLGPGHRRDTALPGQAGTSVIFGRAAAFGGPFARIQELAPGDEFTVITGQGEHTYQVMGLRYAGDPMPPRLKAGEGRIVLTTARGAPFWPTGVARVDAKLVSEVNPTGRRMTTYPTLPQSAKEMEGDTSMAWALVFALQFLVVVEIAAVWAYRNVGARRTWIVFAPLTLLAGLWVAGEIVRLLPNLL